MKSIMILSLASALCAGSLAAQTGQPADPAPQEGTSLMEEGAKLFLRGVMAQMEPALNEMSKTLDEVQPSLQALQPKLRALMALVGDLQNYHAPEKLPNGDIIMRRKTEQELKLETLREGGTDL
jgi:uncharacterized coiled-coil protein SlyX